MPGYNAFAGYDPVNQVTIVIWSNLTVGLDGRQTANVLLTKVAEPGLRAAGEVMLGALTAVRPRP